MQVTCSNCQSKIRVPDSAAGKKGKCPKCGTIIAIPALDEPEEATAVPVEEGPAGSPFDFEADPPRSKKASSRDTDDALEQGPPPRKSKARAADDEEDYDDEDDDRPRKKIKRRASGESVGLSVTSLVLGIVSVLTGGGSCCCVYVMVPLTVVLAATAIVLGVIGMKKGGKVMAIIGMSLGGLGLLLSLLWIILVIIGIAAGGMGNMGNNPQFKF